MKTDRSHRFAFARLVLGLYVAVHGFALVPSAEEVFGPAGMLPDAAALPTAGRFPNPLALPDLPGLATGFCAALGVGGLLLAAGGARRPVALALWFVWACLWHRNPLIANPSLPYVGFLLLVCAVVPAGEPFAVRFGAEARPKPAFAVPTMLREGVWLLLAAGYTVSGLHKLTSPSWLDGSALGHVLDLPLARTGGVAEVLRSAPDGPLMAATWAVLALEIAALPLAFSRRTRRPVFFALVAMHLGILVTVDFADLTAGMLVAHVFAWDAVAGPLAASVADGETRPGGRAPAQGVHEAAPAVAQANGVSAVVQ
jgi:hypothetical protein